MDGTFDWNPEGCGLAIGISIVLCMIIYLVIKLVGG